jgi:hypothetical protein
MLPQFACISIVFIVDFIPQISISLFKQTLFMFLYGCCVKNSSARSGMGKGIISVVLSHPCSIAWFVFQISFYAKRF